jgi:hypothetical protein
VKTQGCVATAQHSPTKSRIPPTDDQRRSASIEKAQKAEEKARTKLSKVMSASASLAHSGSGKVAIETPAAGVHTILRKL